MEDIAADDDLLSDMLVDSLEHNPPIHTHKMNQSFRAPRYKTEAISDIVRRHVVIDHDVASAVDALCRLGVVQKHLNAKRDERQRQEFRSHAKRYFEMYLPDGGVEFALTVRYQMTATKSMQAESSRSGQAHAEERARVQAAAAAAREAAPAGRQAGHKGKARASETTEVLGQSMADLCVVATKPFKAGELVKLCRGGVKDLNKQEDEALKEEAALGRERRKEQSYNGVLGPGRDFSIIRSSRKMCSQLLLGPARFVNHDCQPNCEFYRLGSHNMTFRCLRDIGINEEITTFYGENYFEVDNAECMCSTCEERGVGIFARFPKKEEDAESVEDVKSDLSAQEQPGKGARRVSSRKPKTPPPVAQPVPRTAVLIKRKNGKEYYKTFLHVISGREDDGEVFPHTGSRFHCMTCGEPTWSSETWWSPDECRRCEHHYQIFKADWPSRTPTEGEWQDKAEASRLRRQLAGDNRTLKTADYLLTSGEATPEADSPIAFEPLAGPSRSLTAEAKSKRPSSLTPSSASAMRKKKRVVSDDEQVDTALTSVKSEDQFKQGKRKKKAATRESDAESELTSVSTQDGDETVRATQTSGRASPMSTSSSTSDRPLGPKSLGKHAKTETLAQFWGNIEDGNKRARRPVNNGLESLSAIVQRPGNGKHRRTASDMTALSSQTKPMLSPPVKAGASVEETDQLAQIVKQPDTVSASTSASVSGVNGHKERTISRTVSESQAPVLVPKHDPLLDESGLATRGPARTSNSNLAKAWGADLEGGRGSRRRAALRQASTPTMLSSPRLSRRSDSRDVQSPTPPVVKSGGKPSSTGVMTPRSGSPSRIAAKIAGFPPRDLTTKEDDERDTLPVAERAEPANFHDASSSALELPLDSPSRSHSSSPALSTPSASVDPIAMPTLKTATAPQPDMAKNERTSSAMPIDRLLNPEQVANPRVISPLAGPPPAANAAHPFVVGGQPVRKNLRWGKGKVTTSRPIGGSSPLAGSAATARPCSPLAGPTSHQSSTPPTFVGIAAALQSPGPRSPNSPLEPAREPVRLPSLLQALSADERRAVVKTNGASPVTNTSLPASSQATPTKTADVPPSPRASSRASMPDGHGGSASLKRSYSDLSDEHYAPAKRAGSNGHGPSHANAKTIKKESNGH